MSDKLVLDDGKHTGIKEDFIWDEGEGKFHIHRYADVEPIIDANKRLYNNGDGYSKSREWKRVASIPIAVQLQWIQKYGCDPLGKGNEKLLKRILNDPEWRYLRTAPGMI